jgi:hypothetical protein
LVVKESQQLAPYVSTKALIYLSGCRHLLGSFPCAAKNKLTEKRCRGKPPFLRPLYFFVRMALGRNGQEELALHAGRGPIWEGSGPDFCVPNC